MPICWRRIECSGRRTVRDGCASLMTSDGVSPRKARCRAVVNLRNRWHRDTRHDSALVPAPHRQEYDGSKVRRPGRPPTKPDIAVLVVRMATENQTWGYTRIRGGLKHLGHDVARNTIKAILKDHGIEPAPQRRTKMPWNTFLAAHWDGLAAADFFTVEVLTMTGLVR